MVWQVWRVDGGTQVQCEEKVSNLHSATQVLRALGNLCFDNDENRAHPFGPLAHDVKRSNPHSLVYGVGLGSGFRYQVCSCVHA